MAAATAAAAAARRDSKQCVDGSGSDVVVQAAPRGGSHKANYDVLHKLGEGGFGACYLVVSKKDKKEYVMKVIRCESPAEVIESYKEMVMLRICRHPFIVGFHECFKDGFEVVLVMEYAEEGDVQSKLIKAADAAEYLKEDRILRWFTQITLALATIHSRSFMHRDLKPGNVFLSRWDVVKLGDFGLATLLGRKPDDRVAHGVAGTPGFMSPELAAGQAYNAKSDIWALGCTLYEMCTLRSCFRDTEKKLFPVPLPDCYSPDLRDLLKRLLHADPAQRPTAAELLQLPLLARRVETILRESELLKEVDALEERLEYTPMAARLRKAGSNAGLSAMAGGAGAGGAGAGAGGTSAVGGVSQMFVGGPRGTAQVVAGWLAQPLSTVGHGAAMVGEAGGWLYGVLTNPERLAQRRAILTADEAHVANLRVANLIVWLPLLTALLGLIGGTLAVLLSQFARLLAVGVVCPCFTYVVCAALFPLDGAGAPAGATPLGATPAAGATPMTSAPPTPVAAGGRRPQNSVASRHGGGGGGGAGRASEIGVIGEGVVLAPAPVPAGPRPLFEHVMRALALAPVGQLRVAAEAGAFVLAYLIGDNINAGGSVVSTLVLGALLTFSTTATYIPLQLLLGRDRGDGLGSLLSHVSLAAGAGAALGFAVAPPKLLSAHNATVIVASLSLHAAAAVAWSHVPALSPRNAVGAGAAAAVAAADKHHNTVAAAAAFFRPTAIALLVTLLDVVSFPTPSTPAAEHAAALGLAVGLPVWARLCCIAWCAACAGFVFVYAWRPGAAGAGAAAALPSVPRWVFAPVFAASLLLTLVCSASTAALATAVAASSSSSTAQ